MAIKDWYQKYSLIEAEGRVWKHQRNQRPKLSKEEVRNEILRRQAERKQKMQAEGGGCT